MIPLTTICRIIVSYPTSMRKGTIDACERTCGLGSASVESGTTHPSRLPAGVSKMLCTRACQCELNDTGGDSKPGGKDAHIGVAF